MSTFWQIILGLIAVAAGTFTIIKTEWLLENFGRLSWFEEKLGADGGSRLGYKLIGVLLAIIGVIVMTGSGSDFVYWILGPIIKVSKN